VLLVIDQKYPFSMQNDSPSVVHTPGNFLCCHHSEVLVILRYPFSFSEFGIFSWNRKSLPTLALTLQSGIGSGSNSARALESFSHRRFFLCTILVNFCESPSFSLVCSLTSSSSNSTQSLLHFWCRTNRGSLRASGTPFARISRDAYLRNRTRCYGPTSHKREGRRARRGAGAIARAGNMSNGTCMREDGARGPWPSDQILINWGAWKLGVFFVYFFFGFVKFVKFVVN
jgi:hypothetical protein